MKKITQLNEADVFKASLFYLFIQSIFFVCVCVCARVCLSIQSSVFFFLLLLLLLLLLL